MAKLGKVEMTDEQAEDILTILDRQDFADFYEDELMNWLEDGAPESKVKVIEAIKQLFGRRHK